MNRAEFMRQLESLLQNISRTEREEALQYYNDYFDDAGVENEKEVIEALGNPAQVAENIKRDLTVNGLGADAQDGKKKEPMPAWQIALLVIVGVLLAPLGFSLLTGIVSGIFSLIIGWVAAILGFGVAAIALIILLFILVGVGIMCLAETPLGGVAIMGGGLICGGLGILFLMLTVAMAGIVTPAIFRGLTKLWRWIAARGKKEAQV